MHYSSDRNSINDTYFIDNEPQFLTGNDLYTTEHRTKK